MTSHDMIIILDSDKVKIESITFLRNINGKSFYMSPYLLDRISSELQTSKSNIKMYSTEDFVNIFNTGGLDNNIENKVLASISVIG